MALYSLFGANGNGLQGPSSPVSYDGSITVGVQFEVTTGGCWLESYGWWVCPTGQPTTAQKFCLYQVFTDNVVGSLVASATIESGTLTPGEWNYISLPTPIPLAIGANYMACTGLTGDFPNANNVFGAGQTYPSGITSGPLLGYSDLGGGAPAPSGRAQMLFNTGGSDPTVYMPGEGSQSQNDYIDVLVTTTAPVGTSYRLWPNYPTVYSYNDNNETDVTESTMGTEFHLSEPCTVNHFWFYSPQAVGNVTPAAANLPSAVGIYSTTSQELVSGTYNGSPSWSGAAGSGWISTPGGFTLPAGSYKVCLQNPGGAGNFYAEWEGYFGTYESVNGPGVNGITSGPLYAPNTATATTPGQTTYIVDSSFTYPTTYDTDYDGQSRFVDIEVTPVASSGVSPLFLFPAF